MNLIFGLFQTGILQATQAVNIKFKLGKKSSSKNSKFQTKNCHKSSSDRYEERAQPKSSVTKCPKAKLYGVRTV